MGSAQLLPTSPAFLRHLESNGGLPRRGRSWLAMHPYWLGYCRRCWPCLTPGSPICLPLLTNVEVPASTALRGRP
eukprot:4440415-Pyramimonas_sp.AAC.1